MAKFGIALEWGSRGRWFESSHSDQKLASSFWNLPIFYPRAGFEPIYMQHPGVTSLYRVCRLDQGSPLHSCWEMFVRIRRERIYAFRAERIYPFPTRLVVVRADMGGLQIAPHKKKEPPGETGGSSYAGIALCSSRNT